MVSIANVFFLLGLVVNELPLFCKDIDFYDKTQALSILMWFIAMSQYEKTKNRYTHIIIKFLVGMGINSAYDEFFGNPYNFGIVEIVYIASLVIYTLYLFKNEQKYKV